MKREYKQRLDEIVKNLVKLKFVSAIFLFGSNTTGRMRQDSDIDLAVLTKNASFDDELEIIGHSDDLFDLSIFSKLPPIIQFRVLKEGRILFCRDEKDIHNIKVAVLREYLDYSIFINNFYRRLMKDV